jgi:DNA modification methylase
MTTEHGGGEVQFRDACGKCGARRVDRQIGLEPDPASFVCAMVAVFREVRRVLHPSGVAWVNLGDSYSGNVHTGDWGLSARHGYGPERRNKKGFFRTGPGIKNKDLFGIPWAVAFALRDDGWYLRDAITWAKAEVGDDDELEGSAMPGSQRDRCTTASEMVFMLTKSPRYYFDHEGCKSSSGAMLRNVWRMNAENFKGAHYATFPRELPRRAILLGSSAKGCCPRCRAPWVRVVEKSSYARLDTQPKKAAQVDFFNGKGSGGNEGMISSGQAWAAFKVANPDRFIGWRPSCPCYGTPPFHEYPPEPDDDAEPDEMERHRLRCYDIAWERFNLLEKWKPLPTRPCVVLDPFIGSGTSIIVAQALGRDAIGLDLSREYLTRDARRRIERPHAKPVRPAKDEPLPLFDRDSP